MSKIDYQALREAAEKATCGEWSLEYGEGRFDGDDALIHREAAGYIPICRIEGAHPESGFDEDFQMEQQANAEFIAAANPATVLALLDERGRNQQYIKSRDQENEDIALTVGKLRVELEEAKSKLNEQREYYEGVIADGSKRIAELEAEPVSQTCKLNEPSGNSPVTPDGWVIVPKKLTAENGAKGVLSGEFSETTFISCPECFGDDDCETCDGSGRIEIKVPVSWTTIKTIWAKGCEYFSIVAPQQDG
ncbi:ead/Ea22-like family protein [Escherichia coli]|uniref:ead/Ea22-like family protein n=1 Tax=Escherichia coli TaxID=562 RepID=UPI000AEF8140|nr:ead/Ea22-like family protein [Escherichia coli]EFN6123197.1 ead/Ea22-like family protein [Escherichia coli]EJF8308699.1 ead/Ea22-like family protein [Escherichia coli]MCR6199058.1 ead/Ea22-like family protein [Escherichia coli]QEF59783.1 ead/Ea22-like family protein [Escherichia coli]HBP7813342.1 ead/Ea22-like family protein [Escherichia coli]